MGNCWGNAKINPGEVLDRVISQSNNDDDCLLYKLANYKKGGELVDAYNVGGAQEVEKLVREQFGILMYKSGKGQIVSRTEFLRWKFRNTKQVVIPVESSGPTDPLGKFEDHEACWQMQYRGSLGETLLHVLIICDTRIHTKLARILLKCYPKLAVDVVEGEEYLGASALHLAIAYNNNELVHVLVDAGAKVNQRAIGSFFLPSDQQRVRPLKTSNYEGLAYLGEYPLAWAACVGNESVYNTLLDNGADPDLQDSFGNMILHMVVITDQLGMFGYALRHPKMIASNDILNNQGLTPLTLACQLGRDSLFREMLELSAREFWRYSNITCSAYPLNALDTIFPDGRTNWKSALFMILAGSKEEHLNMMDGGIIQRLLEDKWKTFAQRQFLKRISIAFIHLLAMSMSVYLRPQKRDQSLNDYSEVKHMIRLGFELATIFGCLSFVLVQQGEEIKNQGLFSFLKQLPHAPPKALFLVANFLILSCIPFRLNGDKDTEESLLTFTMVFSWFFLMFFAGAIRLTGPFVTMVYSMITGDMLTFSVIYTIFLLGFSQTFFFLFKSHPGRNETLFHEFDVTWMGLYQMTLGTYDYSQLSQTAYPNAAKAVFIIFMILVPILLLNMLIAMMGNTYSQVIERSEKEYLKQWAKIVVTLERAVSQDDASKYIQEYSIKLAGTDPSNEVRGIMVIKTKSKTRARQRKGAVSNWKRVGKVTITALKKRGMTGEEMRILMWGHRNSVCTPQNITPRQQSMEVDPLRIDGMSGVGLDAALTQMSFAGDFGDGMLPRPGDGTGNVFNYLDNAAMNGTVTSGIPTTPVVTLPITSGAKPNIKDADKMAIPTSGPNVTSGVIMDPLAAGTTSSSLFPPIFPHQERSPMSKKRRNIKLGLRPRIIIFSDKKDLIRVSLDTDESDNDLAGMLPRPPSKYTPVKYKSSKRKSIGGDSMANLTSSRESLAGDTEIDEDKRSSFVNFAFEPDEVALVGKKKSGHEKPEKSGVGPALATSTPIKKTDKTETEKKQERPKSVKKRPPGPKVDSMEESPKKSARAWEEKESPPSKTEKSDKSSKDKNDAGKSQRSKSAKNGHNKVQPKGTGQIAGPSETNDGLDEEQRRPATANDRWSTKDISAMNKIVAWDREEDNI